MLGFVCCVVCVGADQTDLTSFPLRAPIPIPFPFPCCVHLPSVFLRSVFGRVLKGMDVVHAIERVRVANNTHKPFEEIKIINVDIVTS